MSDPPPSPLSEPYLAALRAHLASDQEAVPLAHALGRLALSLSLETLDIARVHDQALAALLLPETSPLLRDEISVRAAAFFTEVIIPVEKTHPLAVEVDADIARLQETLGQRTVALADSNRDLQQGILSRETAAAALQSSELASAQLLKDSRLMEKSLQDLTHQILVATEAERKQMSLVLHDEISQTLLGIHVRLLALKREVAVKDVGFTQEIVTTQRVVKESVKTLNRLVSEFGLPHEN